jgi:nucleoside 2-deoxyribosyltransferase
MKVYLASRYPRRKELSALVPLLKEHNISVTSRWLNETLSPNTTLHEVSPAFCLETALIDLEDIDRADTIVFFSEDPLIGTPRGGRHVEFGYALAKGKRIIVLGGNENIFHFLPHIIHYSTIQDFLEAEGIPNETAVDAD